MRNPAFHALLEEIGALHDAKNNDYAQDVDPLSNFRRAKAFGLTPLQGVLVRMSDKWSRIEQLAAGKVPKNESLRDSLIDNAVYSLLAVLLLEESKTDAFTAAVRAERTLNERIAEIDDDRLKCACPDCRSLRGEEEDDDRSYDYDGLA